MPAKDGRGLTWSCSAIEVVIGPQLNEILVAGGRLALTGLTGEMLVSWNTGESAHQRVQWGRASGAYKQEVMADSITTYGRDDLCGECSQRPPHSSSLSPLTPLNPLNSLNIAWSVHIAELTSRVQVHQVKQSGLGILASFTLPS